MPQSNAPAGESDQGLGPHSECPPARLIEANAPVYVLVGGVHLQPDASDSGSFELSVAPGYLRAFDSEFLPMVQYFRVARTEQQSIDWLVWAGAPEDGLKDLVDTGILVRVDTTSPLTAAASLRGIRIIPQSIPGELAPDQPTLVSVRRKPSSPVEMFVPVELGHVLWELNEPLDLPTAISEIAQEAGEGLDLIARRVLTAIPAALRLELARLEWINAPGI